MLDSKNALWLGSFFSLLLITFCVTRHLDDLNPNFMIQQPESGVREQALNSTHKASDNTTQSKNTTTPFVKDMLIIKSPQHPNSNEGVQELTVDTLHIESHTSTLQQKSKKEFTLPNTFHLNQMEQKSETPKKDAHKEQKKPTKKQTKHKPKVEVDKKAIKPLLASIAPYKLGKTLLKSRLSKYEIEAIFQKKHESNKLNKIAYKYVLYLDTVVVVSAPNQQIAQQTKKIFLRKGIAEKDILLIQSKDKKAITIQLKERK